jgi:hypothetical protein
MQDIWVPLPRVGDEAPLSHSGHGGIFVSPLPFFPGLVGRAAPRKELNLGGYSVPRLSSRPNPSPLSSLQVRSLCPQHGRLSWGFAINHCDGGWKRVPAMQSPVGATGHFREHMGCLLFLQERGVGGVLSGMAASTSGSHGGRVGGAGRKLEV